MSDERFTFFWHGPFSQWHASEFRDLGDDAGTIYGCAEQYMMSQKAALFGDEDSRRAIMEAVSPKEQKSLGRKVRNFDPTVWDLACRMIVYRGNLLKFTQNPALKASLLATAGTTLVEASPYDKVWGIGLPEGDARASRRETWQGENRLGELLTVLREDLARMDEGRRARR